MTLHRRSTGPPRSLQTHSRQFCGGSTSGASGPPTFVMHHYWLLVVTSGATYLAADFLALGKMFQSPAAKPSATFTNGYGANRFASSGNMKGSPLTLDCFLHTVCRLLHQESSKIQMCTNQLPWRLKVLSHVPHVWHACKMCTRV